MSPPHENARSRSDRRVECRGLPCACHGLGQANAYGGHTTHTGYRTYHPPAYPTNPIDRPPTPGYPGYAPPHPPPPYYPSGCYNCAAGAVVAGAAVGMAMGASVAAAHTAAATSNAYAAAVVAGSSATAAAYAMGVNVMAVLAGAVVVNKFGANHDMLGNTWFKPAYGANGVYYVVVAAP